MEKTVKVTVNLKHARMGLRLAGYYDLAQNGSDEEIFEQVMEMLTDYGAKTEIIEEDTQ